MTTHKLREVFRGVARSGFPIGKFLNDTTDCFDDPFRIVLSGEYDGDCACCFRCSITNGLL